MRTLQLTLLLALFANAGATTNVVSPTLFRVGNANNFAPFLIGETESMRYQQVYAASDFAAIQLYGGFITAIEFRPNDVTNVFLGATVQDVQINLSTTLSIPDGLSTVFAENVGPDDTAVFERGRLALAGALAGDRISVLFTSPFLYEPDAGNLLLDVRIYSGAQSPVFPTPFDAEWTDGDTVSRVYSTDVNSPTATVTDSLGLWTRFIVEPVPEPSIWALSAVAVSVLLLYGWVRRRSCRPKDHART